MVLYGEAYKTIVSLVVGLFLANVGVVLRFLARWVGGIKVTVDDYLMLLALVSPCCFSCTQCKSTDPRQDSLLDDGDNRIFM